MPAAPFSEWIQFHLSRTKTGKFSRAVLTQGHDKHVR
jgi:hypothetical protein